MSRFQKSARFVARHRRARWNRAIAKGCRTYLNAFDNLDYDGRVNGEFALLARFDPGPGAVALDVGANQGEWTDEFRRLHPTTAVRAFEVDPETAATLTKRFADDPLVRVECVGLSDAGGESVLFRHARSNTANSLIDDHEMNAGAEQVTVAVARGDRYVADEQINRVAFLKVDTEGSDLAVLRGFEADLAAGRIDAIQFEHNEWSIGAHVHLRDFYDLLTPHGYDIGRVFPEFVLFRPWRATYEREAAGNHVAVLRTHRELRDRLAGAHSS